MTGGLDWSKRLAPPNISSAAINMSLSTPLDSLSSDLGSSNGPPADEERVRRILAEMNADAVVQAPPGLQESPRVITEPPVSMSTGQLRMDATTARANVIGNSTPTMADFHAMFQQAPPGMAPYQVAQPDPNLLRQNKPTQPSWKEAAFAALRAPIAVAVIVFLLNLPVTTTILSRYASWMYLSSGEISVGGLVVKALLAAVLFAGYQTVNGLLDK
jgi:hypothetical protein